MIDRAVLMILALGLSSSALAVADDLASLPTCEEAAQKTLQDEWSSLLTPAEGDSVIRQTELADRRAKQEVLLSNQQGLLRQTKMDQEMLAETIRVKDLHVRKLNRRLVELKKALASLEKEKQALMASVGEKDARIRSFDSRLTDLRFEILASIQAAKDEVLTTPGRHVCLNPNTPIPVRNGSREVLWKPISKVQESEEVLSSVMFKEDGNLDFESKASPDDHYEINVADPMHCWAKVIKVSNLRAKKGFEVFIFDLIDHEGQVKPFHPQVTTSHEFFLKDDDGRYGAFVEALNITEGMGLGFQPAQEVKFVRGASSVIPVVTNLQIGFPHAYFVGPDVDHLIYEHNKTMY